MRNAHCRTWNMARTLKITANEKYEFPEKICSKLRMRNLRVGINATELFRCSTVKIERGTDYLYSKGFEITLNTVF